MKKPAKKMIAILQRPRKRFSWSVQVNRRKSGTRKLPAGCGACK